jgi:hypothetical protein
MISAAKNMKKLIKEEWERKKPQVVYENLPDSILEIRLDSLLIKQKQDQSIKQ